jgi:hypothetical protein
MLCGEAVSFNAGQLDDICKEDIEDSYEYPLMSEGFFPSVKD